MIKKAIFLLMFFAATFILFSEHGNSQIEYQKKHVLDSAAFQSIDSIIASVYLVISQPAGKRDWNEFKKLFLPDARLVSIKTDNNGKYNFYNVTVDEYIEMIRPRLDKVNYFEIEIGRKQEDYNNIAQVFSTYKSTLITDKEMRFESGINSFQLIYYKNRWWIASALFNNESKDNMIPDKYKYN